MTSPNIYGLRFERFDDLWIWLIYYKLPQKIIQRGDKSHDLGVSTYYHSMKEFHYTLINLNPEIISSFSNCNKLITYK